MKRISKKLAISIQKKSLNHFRGRKDSVKRRKLRIQILLANHLHRLHKRGSPWSLSGSRDAIDPPDPQHRHHDVHLRAYGLRFDQMA